MENTERRLFELIQQLGISKEADFKNLDSLMLMSLVLELEQSFQIKIDYNDIKDFNFVSFEALVTFLEKKVKI